MMRELCTYSYIINIITPLHRVRPLMKCLINIKDENIIDLWKKDLESQKVLPVSNLKILLEPHSSFQIWKIVLCR